MSSSSGWDISAAVQKRPQAISGEREQRGGRSMRAVFCAGLLLIALPLFAEDEAVTKRFRDLLATEWEYRLQEAPTFASYLGDKRYNDRWPDASLAAIDRRHGHQVEVLAQLDKIDQQQLSPADELNYQLYRKEVAEGIEQY